MNELPLSPLPYPVYFIINDAKNWGQFFNDQKPPSADDFYNNIFNSRDCSCGQTYLHLKRRGLNVHLRPTIQKGKINVISYDDLIIKQFPYNAYLVVARGDRARPEICQQRLMQNHLNVKSKNDHFVPCWPMPHLQKRDPNRGSKLEKLVYKGLDIYMAKPFRSKKFLDELQKLNVSLEMSQGNIDQRSAEWWDYQQADAVLAVRNCTPYDLSIKPASKLVNAWAAGCPAILGPEPAYRALRESDLDYIEVNSPEEALEAIKLLQNKPELYQAMVQNGFKRFQKFNADAVSTIWRDLLAGPIARDYERWTTEFGPFQQIFRPIRYTWQAVKHKYQLHLFRKGIHCGSRPFGTEK